VLSGGFPLLLQLDVRKADATPTIPQPLKELL